MSKNYKDLMAEMPKIAEVVKQFPESMQEQVFNRLVNEFSGIEPNSKGPIEETQAQNQSRVNNQPNTPSDLKGICTIRGDEYHLTVRDLKAENAKDAAKRLTYVLIYSYMQSMNSDSVSRKIIITPHLIKWRLNSGNSRGIIANDRGIIKNGDLYSLDYHAEEEAKAFIGQIKDNELTGKWIPGSSSRKKSSSNEKTRDGGTSKTKSSGLKHLKDLNLSPSGKQSFEEFKKEKRPTNQNHKCVVAIYYLTKILGLKKVSIDHVYSVFKAASWPIPSDFPNRLHQAGTAGHLDTVDKENYRVTNTGENLVEFKLPKK